MRGALARALSADDVNDLGLRTGQSERLRTITPYRLFLSMFKEWKSYANLHKFDTANEHIAAGLIWASLCAAVLKRFLAHAAQLVGGKPISTRRVVMCASHVIDEIVAALLACVDLAVAFREGMAFLLANARRSDPRRDGRTGRLRTRLIVVGERP